VLKTFRRSFFPAAWLGWQVESSWTHPFLFLSFSALKPISGVLILVFMFRAVSHVSTASPLYGYIYVGNALYIYVGSILAGTSYSILDDRERYRALKYVYIAPVSVPVYLFGRAVARFLTGTIAVVITLLTGFLFFKLPIHPLSTNWPLLILALLLGVFCMTSMGIILGAWSLTLRSEPHFLGEAVAAALYLFSGAVFPVTLLPKVLQPIGFLTPVMYWLELMRRALLGTDAVGSPANVSFSNMELLGILTLLTLAFGLLSFAAFRFFDKIARDRGMIDTQSNF
jgi:ABC-2 type transport system permease protein